MPLALLDQPVTVRSEILDEATRRQFLTVLAGAGLLTACGRNAAAPTNPTPAPRTIIDDRGEVHLTAFPTRIVTTSEEVTELLVGLGLKPVGIGSTRVDQTKGNRIFDGYYLTPAQIGSPTYVGAGPFNLEAIVKLKPDLIVHYLQDDDTGKLARIAPTAVYDVTVPGNWQQALRRLGAGTDRDRQAAAAIDAFNAELDSARRRLAPVVAANPRISVIYPNYRGSVNTYIFGREFALAQLLPDLGFQLVGIEKAALVFPGVGSISPELLGDLDANTIIAVGPIDWTQTPSKPILSTLKVPVLFAEIDEKRPSAGPLSSPQLLNRYVDVLARQYKV